CQQETNWVFTF
nr:immunoglobulin light chain junction region [Macaca mulatta]